MQSLFLFSLQCTQMTMTNILTRHGLTPADSSLTLFMFEIMAATAFLEKTKTY